MSASKYLLVRQPPSVEAKTSNPEQKTPEGSQPKPPQASGNLLSKQAQAARTRGKSRGSTRRKPARKMGDPPKLPPALCTSYAVPIRLRTVTTSQATGTLFSRGSLANSLGVVGVATNSSVRGVFGSFRLKRILAWPAAGGDVNISWNVSGGAEMALSKDTVVVHDLPSGITTTGGMIFRPPKRTVVGDWQISNVNPTDTLFSITATSGSVIDFEMVGTLTNQYGGVTATVGTCTIGVYYYLYPDGSTHVFQPQGVPTTF